jgi:hypothetical protein
MPTTRGLVQSIKLDPGFRTGPNQPDFCYVFIGPSPTNTTVFGISFGSPTDPTDGRSLYFASVVEALSGALFARREVEVNDDTTIGLIDGLRVLPG